MKKLFVTAAICIITGGAAKAQVEVMNDGKVGIGTSSPAYSLDVLGNNGLLITETLE